MKNPLPRNIGSISINVTNIKYFLLLLFCFFPYLNILHLGTDTQPNALVFAVMILVSQWKTKLPKVSLYYFFVFYVALIMLVLSPLDFRAFLSFTNYISILVVPLGVFLTLKHYNGLPYRYFKAFVLVWGIVAMIQKLVYHEFLTFLLSRSAYSGIKGRGVISLSPEPTYYGTMILLLVVVYFLNYYDRKDKKLLYFLIFQFFFLAISSTAIAVLVIAFVIYFIFLLIKSKPKFFLRFLLYATITVAVFFLIKPIFDGTRLSSIIYYVLNNPQMIYVDESIMERFNAAYFPIISLSEEYGLPKGYGNFAKYILEKKESGEYLNLFVYNFKITGYSRILSGYGMGFFELGIFGLIIPLAIFASIRRNLSNIYYLFAFILFNFILFTAMSLNNALILFIIGNLFYISSVKNKERLAALGNTATAIK